MTAYMRPVAQVDMASTSVSTQNKNDFFWHSRTNNVKIIQSLNRIQVTFYFKLGQIE